MDSTSRLVVCLIGMVFVVEWGHCYTEVSEEVCDDEMFRAECPRGEVIIITEAFYGHIDLGRCIQIDTDHLGCKADVLDIMSSHCDGQRECEVEEDHADIKALKPCSQGLYLYLSVTYVCIAAKAARPCQPITVTRDKIFISSKQTCPNPPSVGRSQHLLTASPGRNIEISGIGFSGGRLGVGGPVEVGYLLDEGTEQIYSLSVNLNDDRERVIRTSDSNKATLSIQQGSSNFLLFVRAVGCEDMQQPKDMWLDRDQDELTVGCLNSRKSWSLRCEGVHWRGVIGNCTEDHLVAVAEIRVIEEITMALPRDVVLMIIFAATAVLALIIVTSGYVSYKRSALLMSAPQPEVALLHNDIKKTSSEPHGNRGSVPQGPQYTLMRLQENPSQQQPPPVPPRKENYSAQTTLNLREQ